MSMYMSCAPRTKADGSRRWRVEASREGLIWIGMHILIGTNMGSGRIEFWEV